ncbi:MAG: RagB/SusD family nutrient uptake outer membrane protein [Pseudoflavonifractor sp.]|nr:RagB/SusD family nutrient uptake outer membrane protein [Alloprevotella sp.]MCM1117122.1 RagB/SusD family nutrient uptake outer membrane protein [Pseudoflavonifractor sp.]
MKSYISKMLLGAAIVAGGLLTSCTGDLDQQPKDPNQTTPGNFPENPQLYLTEVMGKCYSSLAISGQGGPGGDADISGLDGGTSNWSRVIFMLNEFTTDEVKWVWPDVGVFDLCTNTWGSSNGNLYGAYGRFYTHIAVCNDFIRSVKGGKYGSLDASTQALADQLVLEARALRALSYYYVIDFFGDATDAWDVNENGDIIPYGTIPAQSTREALYNKVVADLEDVLASFQDSGVYGRVGRDGVEALLCRYYLNSEAWGLGQKYDKCLQHAQNIISRHQGGGFQGSGLANDYLALFCANNDMFMPGGSLKDQNEILWGIPFAYPYTQSYGGTMFLIAAGISAANMPTVLYGLNADWSCMHARPEFSEKFDFADGVSADGRTYLWCTEKQGFNINNTDFSTFTDGYAAIKFTNVYANPDGTMPRNTYDDPASGHVFNWAGLGQNNGLPAQVNDFADTDFPIIRLADVYLMAAECTLRGAGDRETGRAYANIVRARAGVAPWNSVEFNLNNLIDERARELYWENVRRTDLIRFGLFTGNAYNWAWKNNTPSGSGIPDYMKLFPIPSDILATYGSSMKQNPGY